MKLVNKSEGAVSLYRPAGEAGSLTVEPGQSCEIPGEIVTEAPDGYELPSDALLVRLPDGELRTFATSMWGAEQKESKPDKEAKSDSDVPTSAVTPKDEG